MEMDEAQMTHPPIADLRLIRARLVSGGRTENYRRVTTDQNATPGRLRPQDLSTTLSGDQPGFDPPPRLVSSGRSPAA